MPEGDEAPQAGSGLQFSQVTGEPRQDGKSSRISPPRVSVLAEHHVQVTVPATQSHLSASSQQICY